ncbi:MULTISPECIES: zinc ribbon domain-containing protein [Pimelobacter]|uniref:zinc ribbon domain-containing protein n=1 Tax=Pimelobacter TaxID=2044 RepID=UPI00214FBDD5|nr:MULTISPECIES: C4-type zinc ribbon domain-containing protein [Pimelobacter]UUW88994.1 C4-type zinc ribbon domain-containing protein [Pimelobacter simplex]UUW98499.1 C4-type zinc ribbon domain-containing protein [Pimelobacter simplex]
MNADPAAQLRLLDLQALDSQVDQLRHQRSNPVEAAEIKDLLGKRADVDGRLRDQRIVVDDLASAQAKADADVEQVKARRTRDRDRMDSGAITNPKDLERMQHELASLERRISTLEDEELEVMEQLEEAQSGLAELTSAIEDLDSRLGVLTTSRDEKGATIDAESASVAAGRAAIVAEIPADLVALYEKLRASKGGVGVGALQARQCGGCQLTLDAGEIAEIRATPADVVLRHEECQRILVRTPESGI